MNWDSSERWQRRRGNGWVIPLVIIGLIVLTHGWILFIPLIGFAVFAFFGFVLPKLAFHMNQGGWHSHNWNSQDWNHHTWSCRGEKQKRSMQDWGAKHWEFNGFGEKPKRKNSDDIEYV